MADSRDINEQGPGFDWRTSDPTRLPFEDDVEDGGGGGGGGRGECSGQAERTFEVVPPPPGPSQAGPRPPPGAEATAGPRAKDIRAPDDGRPPLPCLEGPCEHWTGIGQVLGIVASEERVRHYQYCRLHIEDGWTMPMHELTIRFCSGYSPPWWSWAGWKQRMRSAPKQSAMLYKAHATPTLALRVALRMREKCDEWGLSGPLGLLPKRDGGK